MIKCSELEWAPRMCVVRGAYYRFLMMRNTEIQAFACSVHIYACGWRPLYRIPCECFIVSIIIAKSDADRNKNITGYIGLFVWAVCLSCLFVILFCYRFRQYCIAWASDRYTGSGVPLEDTAYRRYAWFFEKHTCTACITPATTQFIYWCRSLCVCFFHMIQIHTVFQVNYEVSISLTCVLIVHTYSI